MPRLKIFGRIFLPLRARHKHDVRGSHAEGNGKAEADGIHADILELRRTTGHEGLVNLIETGVEQRDDEGDTAADGGLGFRGERAGRNRQNDDNFFTTVKNYSFPKFF